MIGDDTRKQRQRHLSSCESSGQVGTCHLQQNAAESISWALRCNQYNVVSWISLKHSGKGRKERPTGLGHSRVTWIYLILPHAVFCHTVYTPIKLLTVPARPTMPSSRLRYPNAEMGTVRSQMSEMSWILAAVLCLFIVSAYFVKHGSYYLSSLFASILPSPSFSLMALARRINM
jgi:hypothetical protein